MDESTLESVRRNIENYFNGPLKKSLNYPDDIKVEIGLRDNTFTINFSHNTKEFVYNDEKVLDKIRLQLLKALQFLNVRDIIVKVTDRRFLDEESPLRTRRSLIYSTTLTIELLFEPFQLEEIPDIGIYSNIASNLSEGELNDLCRTDKRFNELCRSRQFWKNLLIQRFPEYNFDTVNNPEQLYKGLLYYVQNAADILSYDSMDELSELIRNYQTAFIYIIQNNILNEKFIIKNVNYIFFDATIEILDALYETHPDIFTEELLISLHDDVLTEEVTYSLDKLRWVKNKQGEKLTDEYLIDLVPTAGSDEFIREILEDLKNKLSSSTIYDLMYRVIEDKNYFLLNIMNEILGDKLSDKDVRTLFADLINKVNK